MGEGRWGSQMIKEGKREGREEREKWKEIGEDVEERE